MAKLRLKKKFYPIIALIIVIIIGSIVLKNIIKTSKYHNTNEYKLSQIGYNENEINIILEKADNELIKSLLTSKKNSTLISLLNTKGFNIKNYDRYIKYLNIKYNYSLEDIILHVNLNNDYEIYTNSSKANTNDKELILVNKYNYLDKNYIPDNLVTIKTLYTWGENKIQKEVYDAFIKMWNVAKENGYHLMINEGYRSYEEQEKIYNNLKTKKGLEYADDISTRPGYSEYQTGLAIDILELHNTSSKTIVTTECYKWLMENAHKYGFILRYPENKKEITKNEYDPIHFRYVGTNANIIYNNKYTLEEYLLYKGE